MSHKRKYVYDSKNYWVDTQPIDIIDLGSEDATAILKHELFRNKDQSVGQLTTEDKTQSITNQQLYNKRPNKIDPKPKPDE